ncbi:hypothetical protein B9G98_03752 [Wickerhamiella sorbophila]|uniref:Uncharacterized protein n=1 Tax=Wickerhamiella sorbophila TaxID=45607 RepID=A0A2T0FMB7_9ASCO|nr:hypothetical protein B9G98_03752 [Wickerhamiella sorbophila]PRT56132.1 hypothetical protein B9G98_03752 [Wickerhamiella sorbophila]
MSSTPLSKNETLSSPTQMPESNTHITPAKRRTSLRLSQTPQQRTPSLSDSPIPVLTPPARPPEHRETPRKTPRSTRTAIQKPAGVTKAPAKPPKSRTVRKKALSNALAKDEKLKHTAEQKQPVAAETETK